MQESKTSKIHSNADKEIIIDKLGNIMIELSYNKVPQRREHYEKQLSADTRASSPKS